MDVPPGVPANGVRLGGPQLFSIQNSIQQESASPQPLTTRYQVPYESETIEEQKDGVKHNVWNIWGIFGLFI